MAIVINIGKRNSLHQGNDNSMIEFFSSHLKAEFPLRFLFPLLYVEQLMTDLPKYATIHAEKRSQKRLGYLSPVSFSYVF
ncbi:hypothetical protein [Sporosarcina sp. FSL K6-3457]|uniref:hypothetical protein n=1 Tax=Sporosarcina sp. FSL K6-3457 TaxID=2978204 RepID=UPI0030F4E0F1